MHNQKQDYWKRYFDDERRNKVTQPISTVRPTPLIRKSKTPEQREIQFLKSEINSYRKILQDEKQTNENLLREMFRQKDKATLYFTQLQEIKKCLLKAKVHK